MDIRCPRCTEPWDLDTLHDVADEKDSTFREVLADFRRRGCVALWGPECEAVDSEETAVIGMLYDLLGDDVDGIACEMEDYFS